MMRVISIVSTKGGAGKTCIATNLATHAASLRGQKTLLIDIDPQGSSIAWADNREETNLTTITTPTNRLDKVLSSAKDDGVSTVFIDYPPHGDPNVTIAARQSDLIVVPCRPSSSDLQAMGATIEVIQFVKKPAVLVLNAVPARGTLEAEARDVLKATGIDLFKDSIGDRVAFIRAFAAGQGVIEYEPKGKAAKEVKALYTYINKKIKS